MKHLKTSPKQTIPDLCTDTNIASSSIQKATILNEFFIRQSQQSVSLEPEDTPSITTTPNIPSPLQSITTSPQEVEKLLSSLDTHKSAGFDNIPTCLLKEAAAELAPSLADLANLSFATGEIPQDWKDATITPFPKAGNPSLPTNYRPISLLSILSKVQERIIYCRLYNYIAPHLPSNQSGFRCKDGTEFQLARFIHHISVARDSGRTVTACFFDLSKAFDRVWHQGLLAKLAHYGVSARVHAWLKEYLTSRRQRVQVEGCMSTFVDIPAGVPQGSVLSPLLFLICTIDLPLACEGHRTLCCQFADNTALVSVGKSIAECEEALQRAVWSAGVWLKQ